MVHTLLLVVLVVCLVVIFGAFLLSPPDAETPASRRALLPHETMALVLPVLGFLATLPGSPSPYFSSGQGLGRGFLMGGIASCIAALAARRRGGGSAARDGAMSALLLALPALTMTVVLLYLRPVVLDALFGVALGWFAVALTLILGARASADGDDAPVVEMLTFGAGVAATLAGALALAVLRDPLTPAVPRGTWSALVVLFIAGSGAASLVAFLLSRAAPRNGKLVGPLVAVALVGLMTEVLGTRVVIEPRLFWIVLIGLGAWPLTTWVHRALARDRPGDMTRFLPTLLVASGFLVAVQLLQGLGAGLFVLALWFGASVVTSPEERSMESVVPRPGPLFCLILAALLVLHRAFAARWSEVLHGVNLTDQYALWGFLLGAMLPTLTGHIADRIAAPESDTAARPIPASLVTGLLTIAIPVLVVLLFGPKCVLALLIGLALGTALAGNTLAGLLAIGLALALDQFTGRVLPIASDWDRWHKVRVLAVLGAFLIAATLAALYRGQGGGGKRPRNADEAARQSGAFDAA